MSRWSVAIATLTVKKRLRWTMDCQRIAGPAANIAVPRKDNAGPPPMAAAGNAYAMLNARKTLATITIQSRARDPRSLSRDSLSVARFLNARPNSDTT